MFENGPNVELPDGIHLVSCKSPLAERRAAEEAAKIFQWEMKHDFLCYRATDNSDFRKHDTSVFLYVVSSRVVGFLVERDWESSLYHNLRRYNKKKCPVTPCRRLDVVWVIKLQRKKGIGKKLVDNFLQKLSKPLALQFPISYEGKHLLRSSGITEFYAG